MFVTEKQWTTKSGLTAKVNLVHNSHRCGYVLVPKDHPYSTKSYSEMDISVHGGLTYGYTENDGEYWIGFDCAHAGDKTAFWKDGVERTLDYCIKECESMAEQLTKKVL